MMYSNCPGVGLNPYSVNVITYSGLGFNLDGEEIAIIHSLDIIGDSHVFQFLSLVPRF